MSHNLKTDEKDIGDNALPPPASCPPPTKLQLEKQIKGKRTFFSALLKVRSQNNDCTFPVPS